MLYKWYIKMVKLNLKKYYTPSIEEFHVGFEFEHYNVIGNYFQVKEGIKKWTLDICDSDWFNILFDDYEHEYETINEHYRVKYLDKEDIESLGFKSEYVPNCYKDEDNIELGWALYLDKHICIIMHQDIKTNIIGLVKQQVYNKHSGNWTAKNLFEGVIKNKSELKRILKQIGISIGLKEEI